VVIVADPSRVMVSAAAEGLAAEVLTPGQEVLVTVAGREGEQFPGLVAGGRAGPYDEAPRRLVRFTDQPDLRPGPAAEVVVPAVTRSGVLVVPLAAVHTADGKRYVTLQGDRRREVEVQLGLEAEDQAEVLSGLREGDVVLVPGTTAPAAGPGRGAGATDGG